MFFFWIFLDLLGRTFWAAKKKVHPLGHTHWVFRFCLSRSLLPRRLRRLLILPLFFFWSRFAWFGEYLPVLHACQSHIHLKLTTIALNHTPNDTFTRF